MAARHKVLLVDDDPDLLDLYRELLGQLPSQPEIFTANSGPRGLAMLEAEPFRLLICDLKMPKVDGLQVLSIVRRKHPQLRTVALTAVVDEQFRSRVYALGVDLFWHKPATEQETRMFLACLESLLGQDADTGFRGLQSKSLVDLVQLECLSQSSSVLRITNGQHTGKIWIQDGEVIDAETAELSGEPAFRKVFSWRAGTFELLPPEPARPRTVFKSYNGLLLESAQALDESLDPNGKDAARAAASPLAQLAQIEGVEFALAMKTGQAGPPEARGLEDPARMAAWSRQTLERFRTLGDQLRAGAVAQIGGLGLQHQVTLIQQGDTEFCIGWKHSIAPEQIRELQKKVLALWAC
jgi:CheY-like chemotaxis protein